MTQIPPWVGHVAAPVVNHTQFGPRGAVCPMVADLHYFGAGQADRTGLCVAQMTCEPYSHTPEHCHDLAENRGRITTQRLIILVAWQ